MGEVMRRLQRTSCKARMTSEIIGEDPRVTASDRPELKEMIM